ncbi:MAG: hypothetical protein QXL94_01835 [Candidatus Parvarchaeum sp.]
MQYDENTTIEEILRQSQIPDAVEVNSQQSPVVEQIPIATQQPISQQPIPQQPIPQQPIVANLPPVEESTAAEHFGRAICLGKTHRMKPTAELTPEEVQCIRDIGLKWEDHLLERLEQRVPTSSMYEEADIIGSNGQIIGALRLINGEVTVCLNLSQQQRCIDVGHGLESFATAQQILDVLGMEVHEKK